MRILSVCRTLPTPRNPGAGIFVLKRIQAMAKHANVQLIQPIPYFPIARPLPDWARTAEHTVDGMAVRHQPMFYFPGVLKSLDGRWLARAIDGPVQAWQRLAPVDAIDAHFGYPDGVGAVLTARRHGIPAFVTIRGLETDRVRERFVRGQMIAALNAATACISVSHSLAALMIKNGVAQSRIAVIPNGIETSTFRPGPRSHARAALGLSPTARLVVSVGHLISGKRHDVLMKAIAALEGVQLAIIGGRDYEPEQPARLRRLAEELRLADRVRFVGAVPPREVANWLRAADVFALATAREGCCNAILEALACGVPVVTTPAGDNRHYVLEGQNGHLVPIDDAPAMATALAAALARDWNQARISATLAVGNWESVGRRVLEVFAERLGAANRTVGSA